MKQQKLQISYLLLAALLGTSCSNENDPITPIDKTDAIELGITAGVSLTKSAITGGSSAQTGTGSDQIKSIAVYAKGAGSSYTGDNNNNYALYTYGSEKWESSTDKIYLTNEEASIYGYHPAYEPDGTDHYMKEAGDGGNALKVASFSAASTININVFQGKDDAGTVKTKSTIPATATAGVILSAPGEVDYMWAIDGSSSTNSEGANKQPTASNGKKAGEPTQDAHKVSLQMKHALAMVSFKIYKDATYKNTGTLTKIVLKNKSTSPAENIVLATYATMTMKIADGTVVMDGSKTAATYTRFIGTGTAIVVEASKESAPKYSILVLPDGTTKFDKNKVQVVFTIDGADYSVDLTDPSSDAGKWLSGKNYLYTAKLSGKELSLTSVTVAAWTNGTTGGDLEVN